MSQNGVDKEPDEWANMKSRQTEYTYRLDRTMIAFTIVQDYMMKYDVGRTTTKVLKIGIHFIVAFSLYYPQYKYANKTTSRY